MLYLSFQVVLMFDRRDSCVSNFFSWWDCQRLRFARFSLGGIANDFASLVGAACVGWTIASI
jgi:hypothetical protein